MFNPLVESGPFAEDSLPQLKRDFAIEIKRNLFEAFLQPRRTIISLVSTTTSSSAAFPGGEAFDFAFSSNGHWTLALSSSRIYLLDTIAPKVCVRRELKVTRKPISASILDDGTTLVVLSSRHVTIYDLSDRSTSLRRSISLDNTPHALAVSPKGEVLAIALIGGIELHSLAPSASDMDRRSVRCDRVDTLTFSHDGTMLIGTTKSSQSPYTVVLTAPYYIDDNQDMPPSDIISHMWTSQIIFPHSSRDCSHSAFLSNRSDGDASWTYTFDRVFESFRAVRTDDLRNGTTYFTGPKRRHRATTKSSKHKFAPSTLPAPSQNGELVATGFFGKDIWIYGVPQGLDKPVIPQQDESNNNTSAPSTPASGPRTPTRSLSRGDVPGLRRLPRWEVLLDKYRNIFAKGRRIAEIPGITSLSWVMQDVGDGSTTLRERLLVAAPGGVAGDAELQQDDFATVDGGRLVVLDFDRNHEDGSVEEVTFEVGTDSPDVLEEEHMDLDVEVELVRRRTRRDVRPVSTVADALAPPNTDIPPLPPTANALANIRTANAFIPSSEPTPVSPSANAPLIESPSLTAEEATAVFDGPYSHSQPRSRNSLYRSATAVAGHRERNPPRIVQNAVVEYRRPGGRGEVPHESDADNWVPPPPPYQPKADIPLPEHLQKTLLPSATDPLPRQRNILRRPLRASTMYESNPARRVSSLAEGRSQRPQREPQNTVSARSVSESLDRLSGPNNVSPLSSDFTLGDGHAEVANASRTTSTTSKRRPVSAYVGRVANSLRRRSSPRMTSNSSNIIGNVPPVPALTSASISLPPSPTNPISPITRSGASTAHPDSTDIPIIPSLPSAEQLANLQNRHRQAPPQLSHRRPIPSSLITSGDRIPAPPRGALGAAGNPSSPHRQSPTSSPHSTSPEEQTRQRRVSPTSSNPSATLSSPSLLRPSAQRLDTIESISSRVSQSLSRSRSRGERRSQSVGPALRLDRISTGQGGQATGERKKGLFGMKRGRKGPQKEEKDGKCKVM